MPGPTRLTVLAFALAGGLALSACGSSDTSSTAEPAAATSTAQGAAPGATSSPFTFTAQAVDGSTIDTAQFAGKPTVLWFWAPWCTVCRAEAPDVAAVAEELGSAVQIVGVAGRGEVPAMRQFVSDTGTGGFSHLVDADGSLWAKFGVVSQPAFAFVSADGSVRMTQGSLDEQQLRAAAKQLKA